MADDAALESAEQEARERIANTKEWKRLMALWRAMKIVDMHLRSLPQAEFVGSQHPNRTLHRAFGLEFNRITDEIARFQEDHRGLPSFRACADDNDTLEEVTRKVLVERGVNPYQYARLVRPDLASVETRDSNEKKYARADRKKLLAAARFQLAKWRGIAAAVREQPGRFYSQFTEMTAERADAEVERLEGIAARLEPTPRAEKPKSSSRKPKRRDLGTRS